MRARLALLLLAGVLLASAAPALAAAPTISYELVGTPGDDGWYRSEVEVWWTIENATSIGTCEGSVTADTSGTTRSCTATGSGGATTTVETELIRVDQTPPDAIGASPARAADASGWFNHPVTIAWQGTDATSGVKTCTTSTYDGPDAAAPAPVGTCRDVAGNVSAPLGFGLKYDATPPEVTAAVAARAPDHDGWFNRPVAFTFQGQDATSGVESCAPATYAGPDAAQATVTATCRDSAGNVASRGFGLRFDATAPALDGVAGRPGDGEAVLRWRAAGASAFRVTRVAGDGGEVAVYEGASQEFVDRGLVNGRRYDYRVIALDQAGNTATAAAAVTPTAAAAAAAQGASLLSPAPGARLRRPPLLRWRAVRRARYHNVQLFRDGRKILSAWPRRARLQLRSSWTYAGHRFRLSPGRYRWYVWPGYGERRERRYGRSLGRRDFVML